MNVKLFNISNMVILNAIRNKFIYFFLFISVFLISMTLLLSFFNLGVQVKLMIDFSLTIILFFGVFIALFLSIYDLNSDLNGKVAYTILTKGVNRFEYVFGKFIGFMIIEFIIFVLLALEMNILIMFLKGKFNIYVNYAVFFTFIEVLVLTAIVEFFSLLWMPISINISTVLFIFFLGHGKLSLYYNFLPNFDNEITSFILKSFLFFIPNLELFNYRMIATNFIDIPFKYYLNSFLYGILFVYFILSLATVIFNKKDLK